MSKELEAAKKRLEDAKLKVRQLEAEEEKKRARELYAFAKQRRMEDTRKKILLGALAQHLMDTNATVDMEFRSAMNGYFTRDDDRLLMGLAPLKKAEIESHDPFAEPDVMPR